MEGKAMKRIKAQQLTESAFKKYGTYTDIIHPSGIKFDVSPEIEFFRDMDFLDLGTSSTAAYSVGRIHRRPLIIDAIECINHSSKSFMPVDGDAILFFAHATQKNVLPLDQVEAFIVPKGTMVSIRAGVWHMAPYACNCDVLNILIIATERFYANDTDFFTLAEADWIEIFV
jgi:ureidoglycolate hydrolase